FIKELRREFRGGRPVEDQSRSGLAPAGQFKTLFHADEADAVFPEFVGNEILRQGVPLVPMNERVYSAPGAAGGDVPEPPRRRVAEVHRKRGNDEEMIFLGNAARLRIVFRNRR